MGLRILSSDLANPELAALVIQQDRETDKVLVPLSDSTHAEKGITVLAGKIHLTGISLPGMMALDMRWLTTDQEVHMTDEVPSRNININFQLRGCVQARFTGILHDLDMSPGRHNLVFAPESRDETNIGRNAEREMLHISIDRQHLTELIGGKSAWAERVLRNLEAERPFSGVHGTGPITPAMLQLIQGIRNPHGESGPMRRLLVHARILELLSLQFGQFVSAAGRSGTLMPLSLHDIERLHQLKAYLDIHFLDEGTNLTQLARKFLLNEVKLKRGSKELFGTTVFGYLKELRMNHAAMLLRDSGQLVEEVAYTLGYEHGHHFSAAFKKHFGNTPGQWVRKGLRKA